MDTTSQDRHDDLARDQAQAAQARLAAAIIDSSHDAIIGQTLDGIITSWNTGAEELYGYTAEEMLGKPIAILVPPESPDELPELLGRLRNGERVEHFETVRVRRDGRRIHISVSISPIRDASGKVIGAAGIARDISERKWVDDLVSGERRAFELMARGAPFSEVLEVLTRTVEALADNTLIASILILDGDGVHLRHGAAPGLPDDYNRAIDGIAIGPAVGSCGTAAYRGEPVVVSDIAKDPLWAEFRDLALKHGLRACWSTPIPGSGSRVLGTFAMYHREPRSPRPELLRLAGLVSRTAAVVIGRRQADETRARLAAIIQSSTDAIIGKTVDGIVTSWNPGAEHLYGYAAREMLGRPLETIVPEDRLDEYWTAMDRVRRGEHVSPLDTVRRHKSGRSVEVSVSLSPVTDESGTVRAVSAIARDIGERRELERLQQEFLAMVTHELRNPIAGIKGFAQLMKRRGEYNDQGIDTIIQQSRTLERLVSDLLDASRLQAGQLELLRSRVDLAALVRDSAEQIRMQTDQHVIKVDAPAEPLEGWWDQTRLEQVLLNLLSNAIKYSPGGDVTIRVRDLGAEAEVSIEDRGRGIAPDQLPHIFERFYRADPSKDSYQSLGLGLYITRGIVESHGGRISAHSDGPGRGCTFTFALPYAQPPADPDA